MSKSSIGWRKAGISSLATAALVAGACVAGAGAANATTNFNFQRLSGTDRYGTSAAVAKEFGQTSGTSSQSPRATDVILASGLSGHYPDALAANYLAGIKNAPVLLTNKNNTPPAVLQAIKDAGASTIWIVGGTGVISQDQEDALVSDGYTVHRIAGSNRFETATHVINAGGTAPSGEGIVATGLNFPDALGAGPLAYAKGMPLAISKQYSISQDEIDALKAAGVTKVLIVGGTKAVSNAVATQLAANNITVDQRLSGTNRSATAEAVANYEVKNGFTKTAVNVASGFEQGDGADALGGGALSGSTDTPMLITMDDVHPGAATLDYLTQNADTLASGDLFGGTAAISADAAAQMTAAAQAVQSNQSFTVAPQDAANMTLSTADNNAAGTDVDADNTDDRSYNVTGLDNTKAYTIALFPADDVTVGSTGQVHFVDNPANGKADGEGDASVAHIVSVNNQSVTFGGTATGVPVNGTIVFKIDGVGVGSVVPVVYLDSNADTALDVDANGAPTEAFGVGGETTYAPAQAANGSDLTGGSVDSVDKTANSFSADNGGAVASYNYDSNDVYKVGGAQATMDQFEAALSRGDGIDVTDYQTNPALVSTFALTDSSPAKLATPTASSTTNTSTVLTFTGVDANASQVTVYGTSGSNAADPTTKDKVYATSTTDADANTAGWQVDVTGLAASTDYKFAGTQTVDGDESQISSPASVTTKSAAASAPTITSAALTTDNVLIGAIDTGDVWTLTFSEPVQATSTNGTPNSMQFDVADSNGDLIQVQCGGTASATQTPATCQFVDSQGVPTSVQTSGDRLQITLSGAPVDRNAGGDGKAFTYPATIQKVYNVVDTADGLAVDLAKSSDVTIG